MQRHFDEVFERIYCEIEDTYGEIDEINVCDNMGEHMIGNCYIKVWGYGRTTVFCSYRTFPQFRRAEDAMRACRLLNNRWFAYAPIYAELSPVNDFREACCRQYEMGSVDICVLFSLGESY